MGNLQKNNAYTLFAGDLLSPVETRSLPLDGFSNQDRPFKERTRRCVGMKQVPGHDCSGAFALVCEFQSIRMVLAMAAEYNLECWKVDYNATFLNADVEEGVYVKMVPGCEEFDENRVPTVTVLLKSLYGLCQSPSNWWGGS